jgi:CheY-like chemotaxis protein
MAAVQDAGEARAMRILYVEDNALIREMTCELLMRPEREIAAFATAEEALGEFQRRPCDVLITDVSLPRMSGLDLARRIARSRPQTAIIIATGYEMPGALEGWEGHAAMINKPFEADEVEPLIQRLLAAANAR